MGTIGGQRSDSWAPGTLCHQEGRKTTDLEMNLISINLTTSLFDSIIQKQGGQQSAGLHFTF